MEKRDGLTKMLAILGTVLLWFPILAPILFSFMRIFNKAPFNFDYLMPAEFFPVALLGGVQLIWSAIRARAYKGLIGWALIVAVVLLIAGQVLAVVTGMASGVIEPVPFLMTLVMGTIAGYSLAIMIAGIGGVLLIRDLYKPHQALI